MKKKFNITGLCFPDQHYMADVSKKYAQTFEMIELGEYFIINRPRQYGKTTALNLLSEQLAKTDDFIAINISFEGVGDTFFENEEQFSREFIELLADYLFESPEIQEWLYEVSKNTSTLKQVGIAITQFVKKVNKKVVLMIDEVDKSSNNQLFISFLAVLRNKYLERNRIPTFHSVILAGLHDVKSLKLKIRPDEEQKYNSPWNIAAEYKVDMNLQVEEIIPMLEEYKSDKGVEMNSKEIAEHLFYYTSGYPFLVSKLCKMLDEDYKKHDIWTKEDIDIAVKKLLKEKNTNFESLTKNIENNQDLYNWVYYIAVDGNSPTFNSLNPQTDLGVLYGIFAEKDDRVVIHNRIYNELLVNYMTDRLFQKNLTKHHEFGIGYKNADGSLDLKAVILSFQAFMKKEYSKKDRDFLEKNGRLVFLAFLKPIINGQGYDFKEVQIAEEKRLDIVVTYLAKKYIIELKLWRGEIAHQSGLQQLSDYLDKQNLNEGFLLIFDHSEIKEWKSEEIKFGNKEIFAAWV